MGYCLELSAQTFYVSSAINPNHAAGGSHLYQVQLTGDGARSIKIADCAPGTYFSIAKRKNNLFWLRDSKIYRAKLKGHSLSDCETVFSDVAHSNSLTVGYDNKLYFCSNYLFSADLHTGTIDVVGLLNYLPSGDLCFYKNELYMASAKGIVKVNREEPNQSTLHIPLSKNLHLYGIVSLSTGFRKNTVYGLAFVNDDRTDIIEFDIENQQMIGVVGTLPYSVLDATSIVEDGSMLGIQIDQVNIRQDCTLGDTANVEVVPGPHFEEFTYSLNGATNTTGKFTGLANGKQYTLVITSASDTLTTTIEIPEYSLHKPTYSWKVKNQACGEPGEIVFQSAEKANYQIKYRDQLFPLNSRFSNLEGEETYHFQIVSPLGCRIEDVNLRVKKAKCKIRFDGVQVEEQCDNQGKGTIKVMTQPNGMRYTFSLGNGPSNATGIFSGLKPGCYAIKIKSDEDEFETDVVVPDFKLLRPEFSFVKVNPACAAKGFVKFNGFETSQAYKIRHNNDLFSLNQLFDNLDAGTHHFAVLSKDGCLVQEFDIELVYEACPIVISAIDVRADCDAPGKGLIRIVISPTPETYTFKLNNSTSNSTGLFSGLAAGAYEIEVKSSAGATLVCKAITVPDYASLKPRILVKSKNPLCDLPGEISFVFEQSSERYQIWYQKKVYGSRQVFGGLLAGNHRFTILNSGGCVVDELNITLNKEDCNEVSFPNTFSPNWDNINDHFRARTGSMALDFQLEIFDRRGVKVFSSSRLHDAWNGNHKGQPTPVGTYFWIIYYKTQDNRRVVRKGSLALIR